MSGPVIVGHISDLHLTEGPRFDQTLACLRYCVSDGIDHGVQLWLLAGDFSGVTVPHRMSISERISLAREVIQPAANHAPVVMIEGNHDYVGDLAIFGRLEARHRIYVVTHPEALEVAGARVFALPYPSKRWLLADEDVAAAGVLAQKRIVEGDLRSILRAWRLDIEESNVPCVFVGHLNVGGSKLAGGEVLIGREVEFAPHDLDELGADYCALGHIHLHQQVGARAWYSGSPDRSHFGETDRKGYVIVEVRHGRDPIVARRETPARRFITITSSWAPDTGWSHDAAALEDVGEAEVRVSYSVAEEHLAVCPWQALADQIKARGALDVKPDRRIVPKVKIRSEAILRATTPEESLEAYWDSLAKSGPGREQRDRCLEKYAELREVG
jgi:exonuclease SbcD